MNRATKLFWCGVVLALGFGIATLLGTPESRSHPTFQSPIIGQSVQTEHRTDDREPMPTRRAMPRELVPSGRLRLRSDQERTASPKINRSITDASAHPVRFKNAPSTDTSDAFVDDWSTSDEQSRRVTTDIPSSQSTLDSVAWNQLRDSPPNMYSDVRRAAALEPMTESGPTLTEPARLAPPNQLAAPISARAPRQDETIQESSSRNDAITVVGPTSHPHTRTMRDRHSPTNDSDTAELRSHIVIDGDTLKRLAERYLGDPNRHAEIFAQNRDVLNDPDLLPIGAELTIPERATPPGDPSPGANSSTLHDRQEASILVAPPKPTVGSPVGSTRTQVRVLEERADDGYVPVRPMPHNKRRVPRAQLLKPIPIDLGHHGPAQRME